jgi:UrcA family protein
MNTTPKVADVRSIIAIVVIATILFAGAGAGAVAEDHDFTIAIHVSPQKLDLSQPADARKFYQRLQQAARVACTHGYRVNLAPVDNVTDCYERALGRAVQSAKVPLLTGIYLSTHTPQQAAAFGFDAPHGIQRSSMDRGD